MLKVNVASSLNSSIVNRVISLSANHVFLLISLTSLGFPRMWPVTSIGTPALIAVASASEGRQSISIILPYLSRKALATQQKDEDRSYNYNRDEATTYK